jgi:hypothetical protein
MTHDLSEGRLADEFAITGNRIAQSSGWFDPGILK